MDKILKEYMQSEFYKKYKDTYFSDSIIIDIIGKKFRKHNFVNRSRDRYNFAYEKMVEIIQSFIEDYAEQATYADNSMKWKMLYAMYIDPDSYSVREHGGITCTADGLLSIRRMYYNLSLSSELAEEYRKYRKAPVFHFPSERNGINTSRAIAFGDRIDHTLYDIKRYCEGHDDCKLILSYELPKTSVWLKSFDNDFKKIIDWFGIKGIFVNKNYEVFDLEYDNGKIIKKYSESYSWKWSDNYYNNIKHKIVEYEHEIQ